VFADPEYYQFPDDNSPLRCTEKCAERGFKLAAVEYTYECLCANGYVDGIPPTPAPIERCNKPCPGDKTVTCGGGFRMQVYMATTA
jgi:hypothetical protein